MKTHIEKRWIIMLVIVFSAQVGWCGENSSEATTPATQADVTSLGVPAVAKRGSPIPSRDGKGFWITYTDPESGLDVAKEHIDKQGQRVSLSLSLNRRLHGTQREWHPNGRLKCESPYVNGREDGLFRVWDEKGKLVGRYEMKDGTGMRIVYNSNGRLVMLKEMKEGCGEGRWFDFYDDGSPKLFSWKKNDRFVGPAYSLYPDGKLLSFAEYDPDGVLSGPTITLYPDRTNTIKFYVGGECVSVNEYEKARETDQSLPQVDSKFVDLIQKRVAKDTTALVREYREAPLVSIPLPDGPATSQGAMPIPTTRP